MSRLLERQIKKHLPQKYKDDVELQAFLEAIKHSYENYDEQLNMTKHAMKISSDELYLANQKLRKEAQVQQQINDSLHKAVENLQLKSPENSDQNMQLSEVAGFIEEQSKKMQAAIEERELLLKSLEKRNQILSDYAHAVSHDLKSPLRSIDSLVNWIMEENREMINDKCYGHFDLILKNLGKMDDLISGILKYSTIDEGDVELYNVDVQTLVDEIINAVYTPKNTSVKVVTPLPQVKGDAYRLKQLFQNLIDNGIKSINKATGLVEVGCHEKASVWEFFVRDNGKGIPARYHKKIFEIFQKIENDQMASGIGLSIVKKVIDFYGGEIWLTSKEGEETTFYFTLPK